VYSKQGEKILLNQLVKTWFRHTCSFCQKIGEAKEIYWNNPNQSGEMMSNKSENSVKVLPDIVFAARFHNINPNAFRIWFLGKYFDKSGNSNIPKDSFRHQMLDDGLSGFYAYLLEAKNLGLIHELKSLDGEKLLKLVSWQDGANISGAKSLSHFALIPLHRFISREWIYFVWAGYIAKHNGLIARKTLEKMTGIPRRTQINWEHNAKVENYPHYVDYGKPEDNPLDAMSLTYKGGVYGKAGRIRGRLPNSRETTEVIVSNKGRLRKIRAASCIEGGSQSPIQRLYCKGDKQIREAKNQSRKSSMSAIERPDYYYEYVADVDGKGVWQARKFD
jgi:hypothetical protein